MSVKYLPQIDGLRAVAVLAVVAYHAGLPASAGLVGVDVFFVISGYLITRLLSGRPIDFADFYARRARRILPALILVVVATVAMAMAILPASGPQQAVASSAVASLLFVGNLYFLTHTGYFDPAAGTQPLLHLWSLAVEEQFYLVWPLLLVACSRKTLALIAIASLVLVEWLLYSNPDAAFFQMPARFWELAAGGLIALSPARGEQRWLVPLGLALLALAIFVPFSHFPGLGALPAVLGAACVIAAAHAGQRVAVLESRPMVFIGLISYSLYLWHWPLIVLLGKAYVWLAFPLAWATWRYVETPFRRRGQRPKISLVTGASASVTVALGCLLVASQPGARTTARLAAEDVPRKAFECHESQTIETRPPKCRGSVVVMGDSMALAWAPVIDGAVNVSRDACGPGGWGRSPLRAQRCSEFNRAAIDYVRSGEVDTLVLAWKWPMGPEYMAGVESFVEAVRPHVRRLVLVGPSPIMPRRAPECLDGGDECEVPRAVFDAQTAFARVALRNIDAEIFEPARLLCDEVRCPAVRDGKALYWDSYHPATSFVRQVEL